MPARIWFIIQQSACHVWIQKQNIIIQLKKRVLRFVTIYLAGFSK